MTSHPPVSISELPSYIERKKANEGLRFSQEYEVRSLMSVIFSHCFQYKNIFLEICIFKEDDMNAICVSTADIQLFCFDTFFHSITARFLIVLNI